MSEMEVNCPEVPPIKDHPDPAVRWKHRRLQSYLCLVGMACYTLLMAFRPSDHLEAVAWPVMLCLSTIVAAYHGFSIMETVKVTGTTTASGK